MQLSSLASQLSEANTERNNAQAKLLASQSILDRKLNPKHPPATIPPKPTPAPSLKHPKLTPLPRSTAAHRDLTALQVRVATRRDAARRAELAFSQLSTKLWDEQRKEEKLVAACMDLEDERNEEEVNIEIGLSQRAREARRAGRPTDAQELRLTAERLSELREEVAKHELVRKRAEKVRKQDNQARNEVEKLRKLVDEKEKAVEVAVEDAREAKEKAARLVVEAREKTAAVAR